MTEAALRSQRLLGERLRRLSLGRYEDAEAHAHRSLALLRPHMQRSRAITSARLARAQLGQGDLEPAVTGTAPSGPGRPGVVHRADGG